MIGILELDERKERSKLVYCNKTAAQSEGMTVCDVIGSDPLASWPPSVALEYRRLMKVNKRKEREEKERKEKKGQRPSEKEKDEDRNEKNEN